MPAGAVDRVDAQMSAAGQIDERGRDMPAPDLPPELPAVFAARSALTGLGDESGLAGAYSARWSGAVAGKAAT